MALTLALVHFSASGVLDQTNGTEMTKRFTVKMLPDSYAYAPSMRVRAFSGMRATKSLHTKVALATFTRRQKACQFVPKAMIPSRRYTEESIEVMNLAEKEARHLGNNCVCFGHILLGLIGEGTGIAANVLKSMGINLKDARVEVEKIVGRGSGFDGVEMPFSDGVDRVLKLLLLETHNHSIEPEQLLLGLLQEDESVGVHVLKNLGADPDDICTQVLRMASEGAEAIKMQIAPKKSYTERVIDVFLFAQEEARRIGHNYVGTEQILLGFLREGTCSVAKALKLNDVNLKDARVVVEKIIDEDGHAIGIPFTPRVQRALNGIMEFLPEGVRSTHLLIGLLKEDEVVLARVLEKLGANQANIVSQAMEMDEIELDENWAYESEEDVDGDNEEVMDAGV